MKPGLAARLREAFLGDLDEQLAALNSGLLALEVDLSNADALRTVFRAMHTLKGAAHATDQPYVQRAAHALETVLANARDGSLSLSTGHFTMLFSAADALADVARRLRADEPIDEASPIGVLATRLESGETESMASTVIATEAVVPAQGSVPEASVRVGAEKLDALLAQTGRLLATRARVSAHADIISGIDRAVSAAHGAIRRLLVSHGSTLSPNASEAVRRVERELRDALRQARAVATHAIEDVRDLTEVSDALANAVRRSRMVPIGVAAEPLPRLVRDVASETGKPTRLMVRGGEIEADRPVVEAIRDSLLHLVRNAIDHGIETPAQRVAAGKPATATVTVAASLHGERLLVTASDDGAGLNIEAIRAKLVSLGRPVPQNDADVSRALFEAGFSTKGETTTISGRGVGLDAVQAAIERVRGTVTVRWNAGVGTTFVIDCPLTLAAIRALMIKSSGHAFAVPTSNIERLLRVRASELRRSEGMDVVLTGNVPIPVVSLASVLGPPFVPAPRADIFPAIIVAAGERKVALIVDALESELEVVVRPIARGRSAMPHVSGGALIGTGQLVIVLNPVSLLQAALGVKTSSSLVAEPPKRLRILVVDDSMTTRSLEQSILEAAGYEVATAVDGRDAWQQLQENGADLVVTDIEMPNMDGVTLCRAIRGSATLANLPVILVTSLENADDRARGLAAGADAYVGKASAGQAGLISTVRDLLA